VEGLSESWLPLERDQGSPGILHLARSDIVLLPGLNQGKVNETPPITLQQTPHQNEKRMVTKKKKLREDPSRSRVELWEGAPGRVQSFDICPGLPFNRTLTYLGLEEKRWDSHLHLLAP
jgi:hypothetical protein